MQNNNEIIEGQERHVESSQVPESLTLDLPIPENQEIVRSEVNLKRWSNFLFPHHRTKNLERPRSIVRDYTLPDGAKGKQKLTIKPAAESRAYTTYTHRVFLALVMLWYEKGTPDGSVTFSLRELGRKLNLAVWGGSAATRLARELDCLIETTINWILSFETKDGLRDSFAGFHILNSLNHTTLMERVVKKAQFEVDCTIQFNELIVKNILSNRISPVNFSALLSFKSSIAEMFYTRADSILAQRDFFHWNSGTVMEELQLDDIPEYSRNAATRKRVLDKIVREGHKKPLSSGELLLVAVERTAAGDDWKLVCTKTKRPDVTLSDRANLRVMNEDPEFVDYLAEGIAETVGYAEENLALYRKLARHYSEAVVHRVLAEYRQERPEALKNPGGFFMDKFHRVAHHAGLEWIKECGPDCPRRPENALL